MQSQTAIATLLILFIAIGFFIGYNHEPPETRVVYERPAKQPSLEQPRVVTEPVVEDPYIPIEGKTPTSLDSIKPKEVTVEIRRGQFEPKEVEIIKGSTITWKNMDDRMHKIADRRRSFYSPAIFPDDTYSLTFDEETEIEYYDVVFYKSMLGTIKVTAPKMPATGNAVALDARSGFGGLALLILLGVIIAYLLTSQKSRRDVKNRVRIYNKIRRS